MLSELKKVETSEREQETSEDYKYQRRLSSLLKLRPSDANPVETYLYRGKKLQVRGIPEDFKIQLDGSLVVEFVYDEPYNDSRKLVDELTL